MAPMSRPFGPVPRAGEPGRRSKSPVVALTNLGSSVRFPLPRATNAAGTSERLMTRFVAGITWSKASVQAQKRLPST